MSGWHWDHLCYKVEEVADDMGDRELARLTRDFAELHRAREWLLSGDMDEDDWKAAVRDFKKKWFGKGCREDRLKAIIEEVFEQTKKECLEMIGGDEGDTAGT